MCNTHSERIKKKRRDQYSNINREVKKATKMDRKNFIKTWQMKLRKQILNRGCVMFIRSQRSYVDKRTCMHANKRKTGHNDNIGERAREKMERTF